MIYAKHAKTIFDDFPGESMEYDLKIRHSCESRNAEGPILGEVRLLKRALQTCPYVLRGVTEGWGAWERWIPAPVFTGAGSLR